MKKHIQIIERLSTLSLIVLNIMTFGVYNSFFIKGETFFINFDLNRQNLPIIPDDAYRWITASSLTRFFLIALFVLYPLESWLVYPIISLLGIEYLITLLWSFVYRGRLHDIFQSTTGADAIWFSLFWTCLFNVFYINYKINKINKYHTGTYEF